MGDHRDDRDAINSENTVYLAELHARWQADPQSVDTNFAALFEALASEKPADTATDDGLRLRDAYRLRGHLAARLDPLGLDQPRDLPELNPPQADRDTLSRLRRIYCGSVGVEFMHLQNPQERAWWIDRLEHGTPAPILAPRRILLALTRAEGFESFCQKRFANMRRFGLEGGESVIVALRALINEAATDGVESVSLGMPHRGRLNVMANILRKRFAAIFSEFSGASFKPDDVLGSGDVKYHLGTATTLEHAGRRMRVSLLANPSHLEAVDPVVLGRVRADQDRLRDISRNRHLGILVHGDAAFAGQGVVYESLGLSRLEGYRTGGTVHVVINNQVGFTTNPRDAHSGIRGTDIAKAVGAPVLHVNADDPEAVARCAGLAHAWRSEFGSDVVLDIVCYRRHGHNETDEPAFTQPAMVRAIRARASTRRLYADTLIRAGTITEDEVTAMWDTFQQDLEQEYAAAATYRPDETDWLDGPQDPTRLQDEPQRIQPMTGVPLARLHAIGEAIGTMPSDLSVHPRLARQLVARGAAVQGGGPIDWATAEALAFGTLSMDGHPVRLSGQDSQRGTFSQRHAVIFDQDTGRSDTPLTRIAPHQAPVRIWNSPLSEYAVLGFEYGYSLGDPESLVVWEAQFGDFSNGAQIVIDQFVASAETKWLRTSSLVLLLPHGYEGGGPEHSSARPERFLELCAENNLRVCNITTPANYFHALRRQTGRRCHKPLVVFTPKSLLRHRDAISTLADMGPRTRFQPVLPDPVVAEGARRIILCSGKVFYDLVAERTRQNRTDVTLIRLEQLYPFPLQPLVTELARHPEATEVVWCQEEPQNNGAWLFMDRRIEQALEVCGHRVARPIYAGRDRAASPASGLASAHALQQQALVQAALG